MKTPKKAGRPEKIRFVPDGKREAILRAVLPEWFPPGLGWMLFYMRHCRQMIAELQAAPDLWETTGALPAPRAELIRDMGDALAMTEAKFAKASATAIRQQDSEFFGLVAAGLEELSKNGQDEIVKRAVADAWFSLAYGKDAAPRAGAVADIANSMLGRDFYLTANRVTKLLDAMALPRHTRG